MANTILLTGGTGSFGKAFIADLLRKKSFKGVIRIYSRDEFKQHNLAQQYKGDKRLRFLIGDVRDLERLILAARDVDIIVHAAALKQVPILEYNPFEAVKTNIIGTQNVIETAISANVKKVILISSDKAVSPVNLYGATKMVAEKLFVDANSLVGGRKIRFSVVRYGNVMGSRGSVVPVFAEQAKSGTLTITDERMTRFWITLEAGVKLVVDSIAKMTGGEIFVPKIASIKVVDLAKAMGSGAKVKIIGIRPGEKIHESLISLDEARHTFAFRNHFVIEPEFGLKNSMKSARKGKKLPEGFSYSSDKNDRWLTVSEIKQMIGRTSSYEW